MTSLESLSVLGQSFFNTLTGSPLDDIEGVCHSDGLTSFHFETQWDEECDGSDWIILFILTAVIHTISWVGRWIFWEPLALFICKQTGKNLSKVDLHRFSTCMTECSFFCASGIGAFFVLSQKPWLYDPLSWNDYSHNYLWLESDFKFYYLAYLARFLSDTLSLPFEDRKREAFLTSFVHHAVTITLVLGSAMQGLTRMGGVIMFFFDWTDPPLLTAKSLLYLSQSPDDKFQKAADVLFALFAATFFFTRNVLYNYVVYIGVRDLPEWAYVCRIMLVVLAALQTWWLYLLGRVIHKKVVTGALSDVREDKKQD